MNIGQILQWLGYQFLIKLLRAKESETSNPNENCTDKEFSLCCKPQDHLDLDTGKCQESGTPPFHFIHQCNKMNLAVNFKQLGNQTSENDFQCVQNISTGGLGGVFCAAPCNGHKPCLR